MSGKWTPGPWVVGKGAGYFIKRPNARMAHLVGMTPGFSGVGAESGNDEEARANAHLMSASPELFDALKQMVSLATGPCNTRDMTEALDRARAALAKAKGEGA
ncbi:hypothetical protein [Asaia krungthepensis]|uniref:Uncharacterized protein n=1 Tax=Asaia krungthepensis NRIC 0535 TaxID=1307925 RepID=A0ABQ0Q348_9PROT|nr:hypothetical protein [Asaia krungthepensis]GBQ89115.1 hypothetical protein AA0535_1715 [Asaia krungthepensis NRIC 0535]